MLDQRIYLLEKLKHRIFPHMPFTEEPEKEVELEHTMDLVRREMEQSRADNMFRSRYPFRFLEPEVYSELEDGEYADFLRHFLEEEVEMMMYLDDTIYHRNTLDHVLGVHHLAMETAYFLIRHGVPVDLGRVSGAAAAHDIGKYGVLHGDLGRIAYYHYYYSDEWYRQRGLEQMGNIAVNHSTWDLELNSLPIESLILIYSDFRVKNNAQGAMHIYTLDESFSVILNKLDNVDALKEKRYRRVYNKLVDFEHYLTYIDPENHTRLSKPIELLQDDDIRQIYRLEGIDESIFIMHLFRSESSMREVFERSLGEGQIIHLEYILSALEDYHLYLPASLKDISIEYLRRLLLHPAEAIRQRSALIMAKILKHYDIVYRKERPSSAKENPIVLLKQFRVQEFEEYLNLRRHALTQEKKQWLDQAALTIHSLLKDEPIQEAPQKKTLLPYLSMNERYLDNLKTKVLPEVKRANLDFLEEHDGSFHYVMHLLNLIKVSSSREIQRYAGEKLTQLFSDFSQSEKNDVTIELLRALEMRSEHVKDEIPPILAEILNKLPDLEIEEILTDILESVKHAHYSSSWLIESLMKALPSFIELRKDHLVRQVSSILFSALLVRQHGTDLQTLYQLGAFYRDQQISLQTRYAFLKRTSKKVLTLAKHLENSVNSRLSYAFYINSCYELLSHFGNEYVFEESPPKRMIVCSANFDPLTLEHKLTLMKYLKEDTEVFVHLRETNWQYKLAPYNLRTVIAHMSISDLNQCYLWPSERILNPLSLMMQKQLERELEQNIEFITLTENDENTLQVRQAIQYDWPTDDLLDIQAASFIKDQALYNHSTVQKEMIQERKTFALREIEHTLYMQNRLGRTDKLSYRKNGHIFAIQVTRQEQIHNSLMILLNEALYQLHTQGVRSARIDKSENVDVRALLRQGFIEQEDCYRISLEKPVILLLDLQSRFVDSYRKDEAIRLTIAKNRYQLVESLHEMYPNKGILVFDRSTFYDKLIQMINRENEHQFIVPIGTILQNHVMANHPTKSLHVSKFYDRCDGSITLSAQKNYPPITEQIDNLKTMTERISLVDDLLHTGIRLDFLMPLLRRQALPVKTLYAGMVTKAGMESAASHGLDVKYSYLLNSIEDWYLESDLYLFCGGLHAKGQHSEATYSLSINRIRPFVQASSFKVKPQPFERFSEKCIQLAEQLFEQVDLRFRREQGRALRIRDLGHIFYEYLVPDLFFDQVQDMTIRTFFEIYHEKNPCHL